MSAAVRIDERLNLVVQVPRANGSLHVHAIPLARDVFEEHFLLLSKTFSFLMTEGLGIVAGPRVAGLALKRIAKDMQIWDGATGVQGTLIAEILRTSNVAVPTEQGWQSMPLHNAIQRELLTESEQSEVVNAIVFFMLNSAIHQRDMLAEVLTRFCDLWGARTTLLPFTAYLASLPTSTGTASSGAIA